MHEISSKIRICGKVVHSHGFTISVDVQKTANETNHKVSVWIKSDSVEPNRFKGEHGFVLNIGRVELEDLCRLRRSKNTCTKEGCNFNSAIGDVKMSVSTNDKIVCKDHITEDH